jgi:hypothetical protein
MAASWGRAAPRKLGVQRIVVAALAGVATLALAAAEGGYFPVSWSTFSFVAAAVAAVVLVAREDLQVRAVELVPAGALAALGALALASPAVGPAELQRSLAYATGALAVVVVARRGSLPGLAGGIATGATLAALYGLATRLFPDRLGTFDSVAAYRLAEPLGYWNALGILCALAALLALGLAAGARSLAGRALAGAALPILVLTLYFTFSRGAWGALALAGILLVAVAPDRLHVIAVATAAAPFSVAAVWLASGRDALTTLEADRAEAAAQGHGLAAWALALVTGSALACALVGLAAPRVAVGARARRAAWALVALACLAALAATFARFGAPWTMAADAWRSFSSPPPRVQNLNERLFTFSSNGRLDLWRAAWDQFREHPLTGGGAGTFERYWLEHREVGLKVRDAHSLYLETLAELGPLGLALLALALGAPLRALARARRRPLAAAAGPAYAAYLIHAAVDWDWEMPAVTLAALFLGGGLLVAARSEDDEARAAGPRLRLGLLAAALAVAAVAFVGLVGSMSLAQAQGAARDGDWEQAEAKARRAATWAPWSPEPWRELGEAQLARGRLADARASFREALAKDDGDWSLWFDLARASTGRTQQEALARAAALNPRSPEIAQLRHELGELGGGIEVAG